jgi:hypothetical protein
MKKQGKEQEDIGSILKTVFARLGLGERMLESWALVLWKDIVGKEIAEKTQPLRVRHGILQVRVTHSGWMHQLYFFKPLLLKKLNERFKEKGAREGIVQDIKFFLGEIEKFETSDSGGNHGFPLKLELSPTEREGLERELAFIEDSELKESLARIFMRAKALQIQRSKTIPEH